MKQDVTGDFMKRLMSRLQHAGGWKEGVSESQKNLARLVSDYGYMLLALKGTQVSRGFCLWIQVKLSSVWKKYDDIS